MRKKADDIVPKASSEQKDLPEEVKLLLDCPISDEPYSATVEEKKPVILSSGQTLSWDYVGIMLTKNMANPFTRAPLTKKDFAPNLLLIEFLKDPWAPLLDPITEKPIIDPIFFPYTNGESFDKSTDMGKIKAYLQKQGIVLSEDAKLQSNLVMCTIIKEMCQYQDKLKVQQQLAKDSKENQKEVTVSPAKNFMGNVAAAELHWSQHQIYSAELLLYDIVSHAEFSTLTIGRQVSLLSNLAEVLAKKSEHELAVSYYESAFSKVINYMRSLSGSAQLNYISQVENLLALGEICIKLGDLYRIQARKLGDSYFREAQKMYNRGLAYLQDRSGFFLDEKQKDRATENQRGQYILLIGTLLENECWALEGLKNPTAGDQSVLDNAKLNLRDFPSQWSRRAPSLEKNSLFHFLQAKIGFFFRDYQASIKAAAIAYEILVKIPDSVTMEQGIKIRLQYALALKELIHQGKNAVDYIIYDQSLEDYLSATYVPLQPQLKNHQLALQLLDEALMCQANHRALLKAKGEICLRLGNFAEAQRCFSKSLVGSPHDNPMLLLQIAAWYKQALKKQGESRQQSLREAQAVLLKLDIRDNSSNRDIRIAFKFHELIYAELEPEEKLSGRPIFDLHQLEISMNSAMKLRAEQQSSDLSGPWEAGSIRVSVPAQQIKADEYIEQTLGKMVTILREAKGDAFTSLKALLHRSFKERDSKSLTSRGTRIYQLLCQERQRNDCEGIKTVAEAWAAKRHRDQRQRHCDQLLSSLEEEWKKSQKCFQNLSLNQVMRLSNPGIPDLAIEPQADLKDAYQWIVGDPGENAIAEFPPQRVVTILGRMQYQFDPTTFQRYGALALPHHTTITGDIGMLDAISNQGVILKKQEHQQQREHWRQDVRQMFLGNPKFPNAYELYTALNFLAMTYKNREADIDPLLDSMREIESELKESGVFRSQLDCRTYAAHNLCRSTRKKNAYQAHGLVDDRYQSQAAAPPPRYEYRRSPSPGGGC